MARVFRNASLLLVATTTATELTSSELLPSGTKPASRTRATGCVDTSSSKLLIHGGYASGFKDDLWAYDLDGNSWTELEPSGAKPSARESHVAAMDTENSRLLIHGGYGYGSGSKDDLWAYDPVGDSWTEIEPNPNGAYYYYNYYYYHYYYGPIPIPSRRPLKPSARHNHVAAMDTSNSRLLIHGGSASGFKDDLWAYDLVGNSWTELEPSGAKPSGRQAHVAAMDTANSKLLIHGGMAASGFKDDLWAYDLVGDSWTELEPIGAKPSGRGWHVAAMDTSNSRLLIHGGYASGFKDDLWAYDLVGKSWTELEPSGAKPSARDSHVAGMADGSRLIIIGGKDGSTAGGLVDVWQFAWVASLASTTTTTTTSMTDTSTTSMQVTSTTTTTTTSMTDTSTTSMQKLKLKLKVKVKGKARAWLKVKIVNGHVNATAKVKAGRRRG